MVLCLEDAVAILSKWKDDSAQILVVSESPFQQSRRGVLEQRIDWAIGLQGKVSKVSVNPDTKGKKQERLCLRRQAVLCHPDADCERYGDVSTVIKSATDVILDSPLAES